MRHLKRDLWTRGKLSTTFRIIRDIYPSHLASLIKVRFFKETHVSLISLTWPLAGKKECNPKIFFSLQQMQSVCHLA